MKKFLLFFVMAVSTTLVMGQTGTLDDTFGTGGHLNYTGSDAFAILKSIILPNGKIVSIGNPVGFGESYVKRHNPDGSLDTTFQFQHSPTYLFNSATDIVALPDNKLLVALVATDDIENDEVKVTVMRLNENGSLDATFVSPEIDHIMGYRPFLFAENNGKSGLILPADDNLTGEVTIIKFTATGTLDTSFGTNGVKLFYVHPNPTGEVYFDEAGNPVTTNGQGNIYFTYEMDGALYVTKADLNFNASTVTELDSDFSQYTLVKGDFLYNIESRPTSIKVQRFYSNTMAPDITYGNQSITTLPISIGNQFDWFSRGVLQPDGKLLVVVIGEETTLVSRFNADGSVDTDFGTAGTMSYSYTLRTDEPSSAHFNNENQKLYVIHVNDDQDDPSFMITRIHLGNITAHVNENALSNYSVYPNPSSDFIVLPKNAQEISVMDGSGKIVLNKFLNQEVFDVTTLRAGLYILKIKTREGTEIKQKFVKK